MQKGGVFLKKDDYYLSFCDGSTLKSREVILSLRPDVAFKLERLAAKENKTLKEYILFLLSEHTEKNFKNNKDLYKRLFEKA